MAWFHWVARFQWHGTGPLGGTVSNVDDGDVIDLEDPIDEIRIGMAGEV